MTTMMALRRNLPSDIFGPLGILGSRGLNTWNIVDDKHRDIYDTFRNTLNKSLISFSKIMNDHLGQGRLNI